MSESPFVANGLITLSTDFGSIDPYVGAMKGVILTRYPAARLVDLTHQIPDYQPQLAGFWLARIYRYFAAGTVHLAVVDPGVGTARGMVLLYAASQVFIAPDNGLLEPVARAAADARWRSFSRQDLNHLRLPTPSRTFHGRDIFAPLVAEIASGKQSPETLGRVELRPIATAERMERMGHGHIVWVDHYGNLITDIDSGCLERFTSPVLCFRDQQILLRQSYGFAAAGELLGLVNSWGTLEIAVAQGSAQQRLQAQSGDAVWVVEGASVEPAAG